MIESDVYEGGEITSAVIEGLIEIINYSDKKNEIEDIESVLESVNISIDSVKLGFFLGIFIKKSKKVSIVDSEMYNSRDYEKMRRNIIFSLAKKKTSFLASVVNCSARCIKSGGSSRMVQIISDANLSEPLDEDGEHWWWNLQSFLRVSRDENIDKEALEGRGRIGEHLSKAYEKARLEDGDGSMVEIVSAIDGDRKGYDILSYRHRDKKERLRIEVKASKLELNKAKIYLTWREWEVAKQFGPHEFHLWPDLENPSPSPIIISLEKMSRFIPKTEKGVKWPNLEISMKLLADC